MIVNAERSIAPAETLDPDGTIPVTIVVSERKPRVIGAVFGVDAATLEQVMADEGFELQRLTLAQHFAAVALFDPGKQVVDFEPDGGHQSAVGATFDQGQKYKVQ